MSSKVWWKASVPYQIYRSPFRDINWARIGDTL